MNLCSHQCPHRRQHSMWPKRGRGLLAVLDSTIHWCHDSGVDVFLIGHRTPECWGGWGIGGLLVDNGSSDTTILDFEKRRFTLCAPTILLLTTWRRSVSCIDH